MRASTSARAHERARCGCARVGGARAFARGRVNAARGAFARGEKSLVAETTVARATTREGAGRALREGDDRYVSLSRTTRRDAFVGRLRRRRRCDRTPGTRASAGDAAETRDDAERLPPLLRMRTSEAVWYVGWPTTVIGLLRSVFPITDTFWVGKLGTVELTALCSNAFAGWMLYLVSSVVANGVQNKVSQSVGAGETENIGPVLRDGMYGAVLTAAALATLVPFTAAYSAALGIEAGAFAIGQSHLRAALLGSIGLCMCNVLEATLRGFGSMKPALRVTTLMVLLNIILDPLFIYGVGPFPQLGVRGAAVGTSVSYFIGAILFFRMLVKNFNVKIPFTLPNLKRLREIVAIGWPIAVAGIVFAIVYVGLGRILTSIDPIALTAMGLGQQFENIPYTVTDAFRVGASTLVGQWIGARNATRARDSCWSACQISMIALLPFAFIFIGFAPQFIGLLTSDPIVASRAATYMYWNFPIVSFMALECAVEGAFNGTGITYPVIIIALMLNLTRLPMAAALAPTYGVNGVWFTIVATQVVKSVFKAFWLRRVLNRIIADEHRSISTSTRD
jgi:putative MATE family efflux protein